VNAEEHGRRHDVEEESIEVEARGERQQQESQVSPDLGAKPKKSVTIDTRRSASSGPKRSRIMARPTTMPAPTDRPWTTRPMISPCTESAIAHQSEARV